MDLIGWDRLRHGGLLLDPPRLRRIAEHVPDPLPSHCEIELRRRWSVVVDDTANSSDFIGFVLETVCGFTAATGSWQKGTQVGSEWGRITVTGETVKPRRLWRGINGGILPIFVDSEARLGIGRGRKAASRVAQWLRAGTERLAVLTNGRQWRLICAGLDFDAWCEWDIDLWFEEGGLSPQVHALRVLLSPRLWIPPAVGAHPLLLSAILDSRKGQAELSAVLGERVREAVELLVHGHGEMLQEHCAGVESADIYRAAVRMVMRMVVVLFAESRELLPRENALYHGAYGLNGLLEDLEKIAARGGNRLARSWNGWPRILALFRLVHQGSHHSALPVPAYGGDLFAPGNPVSADGLSRALALFESAAFDREILPDRDVLRILERITRTRVKVRQGRTSTWVPSPVDFSDLSSEYIGILYEGLLDFELKTAPEGDPVIFLAVGNQPALPLSRLEGMDDKALSNLLEKMKDTSKGEEATEEDLGEESEAAPESDEEPVDEESEGTAEVEEEEAPDEDARHATRTRAEVWARRAVEVGKLVRKPSGAATPEKRLSYEESVSRKARQLVVRVILPGEWYLVRWGGTRKGAGTFYTRPGLAVPTVHRTLRPLAYTPPANADGSPEITAPHVCWTPKTPEEILSIKVCDPACGSGTFPVAALRFLTEALFASLHVHGRISAEGDRGVVHLLSGAQDRTGLPEERLGQELLPCRPEDPLFEPRLKAILRRYVVERSIYGVDLDPLAVELCRLALWIETMDRTLPFSFIDHKVKCGNGLVGAWFDQFQHYPAMAWKNREGGDKNHGNGVHFEKEARGKALKAFVKDVLTPDLRRFLEGRTLFSVDLQEQAGAAHDESLATLSRLHDLPVQEGAERARIYREELLGSPAYNKLKAAMDLWCACWFWPVDELDCAPFPTTLATPSEETQTVAARIAAKKRFFHWELEFPDVFRAEGSGFDAILGNPPWDIAKPNSKEYFSDIDPLYRAYGKQEALQFQADYFEREEVECAWIDYNADFRAQSNFMKYVAAAFGDPECAENSTDRFSVSRGGGNDVAHARWRADRKKSRGYADPSHPFRHQGSADINLYKTFLEQAHALLRIGGRLGFIVPSGLYSDHGTGGLRRLFLDHCRWEWLFGFENRDAIFEIHRSFKFNAVVIEKGGATEAIRTAFMRRKLEDWEFAESLATPYARTQVEQFSPRSEAILEIQSQHDLEILEKIYSNAVLLGDDGPDGWGIRYATEFHMTNDSKLFPPRPKWEAVGYRPDEYSRWLKGNWRPIAELWTELSIDPSRVAPLDPACEKLLATADVIRTDHRLRCAQPPYDVLPVPRAEMPEGYILSREADAWIHEENVEDVALPLYEGRMVNLFDHSEKGWESGKGRQAKWDPIGWGAKQVRPQYLMSNSNYIGKIETLEGKIGFLAVGSGTNTRSMYCSMLPDFPCGNSVAILKVKGIIDSLLLTATMASFVFDYIVRLRLTGVNLNYFIIEETPIISSVTEYCKGKFAGSIALSSNIFSPEWVYLKSKMSLTKWKSMAAFSMMERIRVNVILDAIALGESGISGESAHHLLSDCDHSIEELSKQHNLNPKGFWRIDKDKTPELRHTVLSLVAFHDLERMVQECAGDRKKGIEAFLNQNDGEGWMLPETLCLADYGLGHDDRAKEPQPVASRFGPRFYDWQLAQITEESWRECHLHARNLLGEGGYKRLLSGIAAEKRREEKAPQVALSTPKQQNGQGSLF